MSVTPKQFIDYAKSVNESVRAKTLELDMLLDDAANPRLDTKRLWITVVVDYGAAMAEYLALVGELEALVGMYPKSLNDVPT